LALVKAAHGTPNGELAEGLDAKRTLRDVGHHRLRSRAGRQAALSGHHAAAQQHAACLRQGRHPGELARHHRREHGGRARRRQRRQPRRRDHFDDRRLHGAYKGIGLEDYVTFEADYSAEGFDDVRRERSKACCARR
jgi:hypothetical protein